jgi:hypothetical protein
VLIRGAVLAGCAGAGAAQPQQATQARGAEQQLGPMPGVVLWAGSWSAAEALMEGALAMRQRAGARCKGAGHQASR